MDVIGWATSNVSLVLTGVLALVVLVWLAEAVDEAEDRAEAMMEFGDRAKSGTGGAANLLLVAFLAVAGWAATVFATVGDFAAFATTMAPEAPVLSGAFATSILGAVGLSGAISISPFAFLGIAFVILGIAYLYRRGFGEGGLL